MRAEFIGIRGTLSGIAKYLSCYKNCLKSYLGFAQVVLFYLLSLADFEAAEFIALCDAFCLDAFYIFIL